MKAGGTACLWLVWLGCGSQSTSPADAGSPVDSSAANDAAPSLPALELTPPQAPLPPDFGECPDGWRTVSVADVDTCEPWPEGRREDCAATDEAQFPGEPGCTRVGTPCTGEDFPQELPADAAVRFVRAGAEAGDGTRKAPFGTIGEALTGAPAGTIVAIAPGTYLEEIRLRSGVTLWGACVAQTVLQSAAEYSSEGVVHSVGADTAVRNLTIGSSPRPGITVIGDSRSIRVQDVIVDGVNYAGLEAFSGGDLQATSVVVRGTREGAQVEASGSPVQATDATASLSHVLFVDNDQAVRAIGATALVFEDGAVLDPRHPGLDQGRCVESLLGATVTLHGVVLEGCHDVGALSWGATSMLDADLLVVRRTSNDRDGYSVALQANQGGAMTVSRALVSDCVRLAVQAGPNAGESLLRDVVVADIRPDQDGFSGAGIVVSLGSSLELDRIVVARASAVGVGIEDGSTAAIRDLRCSEIQPDVRNVGIGLQVLRGSASVARAAIESSTGAGVAVSGSLEGEDVTVVDTAAEPGSGVFGNALYVGDAGSRAVLTRLAARNNHEVSVHVYGDSTVELHESAIEGTRERECAASTCVGEGAGTGIGAYTGARVLLDRVAIRGSPFCGVQMAAAGQLDFVAGAALPRGEVRDNRIGRCVEDPAYDMHRLTNDVLYVDNEQDDAVGGLPFPSPNP